VLLWTAACVSPVDCGMQQGTQPGEPQARNLRPIACAECLMKLVESIEIEAQISDILTKLEPAQVGCGTPDAAPLVVYIARTWAAAVLEAAENETPSEGTQILAGLDLENAYGRAHRSTCLEGCKIIAPRLARLAAMQWSAGGSVAAFQRWMETIPGGKRWLARCKPYAVDVCKGSGACIPGGTGAKRGSSCDPHRLTGRRVSLRKSRRVIQTLGSAEADASKSRR
jgi:hypothetical protein